MGLSTSEILDRERLLRGERCPECSSHRLTMSIDWWINCKDCGMESNGAHLLDNENKRLKRDILNVIQAVAPIIAQAVTTHIEAMAMAAENKERELKGLSLAYPEEAFLKLIEKFRPELTDCNSTK